jgi:uncharacterized membrane protein YdbT with pleckstrin-like domain
VCIGFSRQDGREQKRGELQPLVINRTRGRNSAGFALSDLKSGCAKRRKGIGANCVRGLGEVQHCGVQRH